MAVEFYSFLCVRTTGRPYAMAGAYSQSSELKPIYSTSARHSDNDLGAGYIIV